MTNNLQSVFSKEDQEILDLFKLPQVTLATKNTVELEFPFEGFSRGEIVVAFDETSSTLTVQAATKSGDGEDVANEIILAIQPKLSQSHVRSHYHDNLLTVTLTK